MSFSRALKQLASVVVIHGFIALASRDFNYYPRLQKERLQSLLQHEAKLSTDSKTTTYNHLNDKTESYLVRSLPDVNFDFGEMYSGSVPIHESNPNRTLFFVYKPIDSGVSTDLTIWLNGGPGCSSLVGFFQENGPILWQPGVYAPFKNPYSWSTITNLLWVEQPVGTGFAQGTVEVDNEVGLAKEFSDFFKNWENLFDIKDYKIYLTGESYAGRYVPYIAAEMLDRKDNTYYDVGGALAYDPCIGSFNAVGQEMAAYGFAEANSNILGLNQTFLESLQSEYQSCGAADFVNKYMTFPPPENQPVNFTTECDLFSKYVAASVESNPCFDIYHITNYCPIINDPVAGPFSPIENTVYFNRTDVKQAMHAPLDVSWSECAVKSVFKTPAGSGPEHQGDPSPDPIQGVLPKVIEATNRVLVGNGDWDGLLLSNGTLLSIQNMTWNGKLGFQSPPGQPLVVLEGDKQYPKAQNEPQGTVGQFHFERGLMYVTTAQSGHMQPEFQPRATLRHLQWLLGMIETF